MMFERLFCKQRKKNGCKGNRTCTHVNVIFSLAQYKHSAQLTPREYIPVYRQNKTFNQRVYRFTTNTKHGHSIL